MIHQDHRRQDDPTDPGGNRTPGVFPGGLRRRKAKRQVKRFPKKDQSAGNHDRHGIEDDLVRRNLGSGDHHVHRQGRTGDTEKGKYFFDHKHGSDLKRFENFNSLLGVTRF